MNGNENGENGKLGELIISEEVIASIALNAARDVEGVAGFSQKPADIISAFKRHETNKNVSILFGDSDVKITIYIVVKPGYNIQNVANDVQKAIKSLVQNMTGKIVSKVNVTIAGLESAKQ
ncbi:MAG: hypothetical protein BWY46_02018 [Firmicutes bacterium ADurb.Bin300]|jgi:uncharacterized alkaline shock family protein YloU|nr:MAG: hypothetical protein BWY46_02018 [Firmicutes bacterium ADurb.Bin300]HOD02869.1 Asp23/Gls24 family envelope stress response protein [Clostridiales bacterium]